jgi:hypothetical protein
MEVRSAACCVEFLLLDFVFAIEYVMQSKVQCCESLKFGLVDLQNFKCCGHKINEGDIICF